MFDYRMEIGIDVTEELPYVEGKGHFVGSDTYVYDNKYYGFSVKDINVNEYAGYKLGSRIFVLSGTSTLGELKTMFMKLADEIVGSDMPPKYFKTGITLLQSILGKQDEKDFEDNAEYEVTRHYPAFGIRFYLFKQPAPIKKEPEPDGSVTGSLWKVTLKLNNKAKDSSIQYDETVFCIKPESAVHEVIDRLLRIYNNVLDRYTLEMPVSVEKLSNTMNVSYIVTSDEEKQDE